MEDASLSLKAFLHVLFSIHAAIVSPFPSSLSFPLFDAFVHGASFSRLSGLEGEVNMKTVLNGLHMSSRNNMGSSTCKFHAQD